MQGLRALWLRARSLFRKRLDRDLDDEMRFHFEMAVDEKIESGTEPGQARYEAMREVGNTTVLKERSRELFSFGWIETILQDVRYALRMLRRSPGFTAAAVLSLALGIGANTAIFSVVDVLLLRMLPVRSPEQLVTFERTLRGQSADSIAYPIFEKFRDLRQVFSGASAVAQLARSNLTINGPGGGPEPGMAQVDLVSGGYFPMLGVQVAIGRTLTADDDRVPGAHPVAVIGYRYWDRRFARAGDILGRTFTLGNVTYTIVGVAQKGFLGENISQPVDFWIPMAMQSQVMPERPGLLSHPTSMWTGAIARLQPGVDAKQAQALLEVTFQQYFRDMAGSNASPQTLQRFTQQHIALAAAGTGFAAEREVFAKPLKFLMMVVGLVLSIACANVANLLLARSAARQREVGIRLAIGAGRMRIARQVLTESVILSMIGGALGLLFARWGANALLNIVASGRRHSILDIHPDARILGFTFVLCLFTGILFGLAPAFRASKTSLTPALNERGAGSLASTGHFGFGKVLVVLQVAISLMLLIGAGLFVRTLSNLESQDLGFNKEHVLLVWTAPGNINLKGAALEKLYETVQERISALPGVISASPSRNGLLSGFIGRRDVNVEGYVPKSEEDTVVQWSIVAPQFFETIGMRLLAGRDFNARDRENSPQVAIINATMARDFFQGRDPIGKRFGMGKAEIPNVEIVGVVKDSKYFSLRDSHDRMMYLPYHQDVAHLTEMCIAVRTAGDPGSLAAAIRNELRNIDRSLPIPRIDTAAEQVDATLVEDRLVALLSGFFGVLAVLLACLGLYGVLSYTAARRTNEIGIRLALGATRGGVLGMVMRESLLLVIAGIAIGVPATLATTRLASSLLFGIGAADPLTIVEAVALMIAVAALAGFIPSRRASRVDPMVALRYE